MIFNHKVIDGSPRSRRWACKYVRERPIVKDVGVHPLLIYLPCSCITMFNLSSSSRSCATCMLWYVLVLCGRASLGIVL